METLTKEQRDILLDYYFECADQRETDTAKQLLGTHKGAVEFYSKLHDSLSPLEHLDHEIHANCPDYLVEKTLEKLYPHNTEAGSDQLEKLLRAESEKIVTKRPSFWRNLVESAAIAAGIFIIASIFIPVTRQMRAQATKTACQANLAQIAQGITQYAGENEGSLPAVATKAGNPWWKVGSTEQENQSNTRHVWLLVRKNYLGPEVFLCPGSGNRNMPVLEKARILAILDFPDRRYISYSFKLISEPNKAVLPKSQIPLMSDTNPIFENCLKDPYSFSKPEFNPVKLNEKLLKINSSSHRGKGQNIMFSDGTVKFTSQRTLGQNDDIFTVKDLDTYRGTETPSSETDTFLVP
ncbi:MAG: hypothetical protein WCE45_07260 [Sedimentisphaerales bacterium]